MRRVVITDDAPDPRFDILLRHADWICRIPAEIDDEYWAWSRGCTADYGPTGDGVSRRPEGATSPAYADPVPIAPPHKEPFFLREYRPRGREERPDWDDALAHRLEGSGWGNLRNA